MAIYKEVFRLNGSNPVALAFGANLAARFPSRLRIRMSEHQELKYGGCNSFRFVNKSGRKIRVHFTWSNANEIFEDMEANSIRNITVEDGITAYGFDIENLDTAVEVPIDEVHYTMARVEQLPEVQ